MHSSKCTCIGQPFVWKLAVPLPSQGIRTEEDDICLHLILVSYEALLIAKNPALS
jgi:hypothetical protein